MYKTIFSVNTRKSDGIVVGINSTRLQVDTLGRTAPAANSIYRRVPLKPSGGTESHI